MGKETRPKYERQYNDEITQDENEFLDMIHDLGDNLPLAKSWIRVGKDTANVLEIAEMLRYVMEDYELTLSGNLMVYVVFRKPFWGNMLNWYTHKMSDKDYLDYLNGWYTRCKYKKWNKQGDTLLGESKKSKWYEVFHDRDDISLEV